MERAYDFKRQFDWAFFAIFGFGPAAFFIRFDDGRLFRHSQFHADVGVHVAVGDVVYYLAGRPAAAAIRFVQITAFQAFQCFFQVFGQSRDQPYVAAGIFHRPGFSVFEFSDGISSILL